MDTLYEYYVSQGMQPTYANFSSDAQLEKYAELRSNVFHRLQFPPEIFSGKRVLEFGPDTGENTLVFARWGARLTLVEPNVDAHAYIKGYFARFAIEERLENVVSASVMNFSTSDLFDVVDAEGFIYTIQPNSAWIEKLGKCLKKQGFLIVTYMELYGSFLELLLKAIYRRVELGEAHGVGLEVAKSLFLPKWNSVQHTRKIDSWFMDVIKNPFVRRKFLIDPAELLRDMHVGDFRLYSSWPVYRDALSMDWIKASLDPQAELNSSVAFVEQSRLSHLLGRKCFLHSSVVGLSDKLASLIQLVDDLIDHWSPESCATAIASLEEIEGVLGDGTSPGDGTNLSAARDVLAMVKTVFRLMKMDDTSPLVDFCQNDRTFISSWGTPNHYAVFQRNK